MIKKKLMNVESIKQQKIL